MAGCDDTRQLTEAQRVAGYQQQRTGVQRAVRPFTGTPSLPNLIDYINRELMPAVKANRTAVNDVYLQVADNAPSANPLGYYFSELTAGGDPTTGRVTLNASPQSSGTVLRLSQTNGRLVDVLPWLDVMAGSVTAPLGVVTLADAINPGRFLRADLNTMVDQGAYWDLAITITEASHPNPFVEAEAVTLAFIPGVADNGGLGAQVPPGSISPIATDTFLGNISGASTNPSAVPLASVDSTSIAYDGTAHEFRRAALTGFAAAAANTNATTSAEPIVTYSASSNMSAERVTTSSTSVTVSTSVASQIEFQRAALTGDITASDNSNATAFRSFTALSVLARAANSTGAPADVSTTSGTNHVLRESGGVLGFGQVALSALSAWGEKEDTNTGTLNDVTRPLDERHVMFSGLNAIVTGVAGGTQRGDRLAVTHQDTGYTQLNHNDTGTTGATGRFFHAQGSNIRLVDNEAAFYCALDATSGGTTAQRWICVSHRPPFCNTSANVSGDVLAHNGTDWAVVNIGTNTVLGRVAAGVVAAQVVTAQITDDNVTDAKLRNSGALSVIGRAANSSGDPADISAVAAGNGVLRESGSTIGFGTIALGAFPSIADDTFLANISGSSAQPTALALTTLAGAGLTGGADAILAVGQGTYITVSANDVAVDRAALAADLDSTSVVNNAGVLERAALTGDVTASQNGNATTIANDAVTNAKLANMAAATVKGRATGAGTGDPTDLTAAEVAAIARSAAWTEVEETGAGPHNDYNATATTHVHVMASNAAGVFTGVLSAGVAGAMLLVSHQGTGYTELQNNNTSSAATSRFFNGRQGKNLRLHDNEAALFIAADQTTGGTTSIRWMLVSPNFPYAQSDDDATGDIVAFTGSNYARVTGGNSADVVLRGNATFGTVSNAAIRDSAALSVIGRSANSTGDVADIAAANDGEVLRRSGTTLGFGTVATAGIADAAVTLAKQANLAQSTIIGRAAGAGTGVPTALTGTQVADIVGGTLVARTVYESGSGDHVMNSITSRAVVTIVGGGAAGGGVEGGAVGTGHAAAGGGASGAFLQLNITSNLGTHAYAVGAGGAGVSAGNGNNGGSSTFHDGSATRTANGGNGGDLATLDTLTAIFDGGGKANEPSSVGAFYRSGGSAGGPGVRLALEGLTLGWSGRGGDGPWGGGGQERTNNDGSGNGFLGTGPGAGGSGAFSASSTTDRTGGAGQGGLILVEEYS